MKRLTLLIRIIAFIIGIAVLGFSVLYLSFRIWIKSDINNICDEFSRKYKGDRLEILTAVLASETESLDNKNKAIWVLEYIGDESTLPYLKKFYNNKPCNHSAYVCQRELKRAIDHVEGRRINIMYFSKGR